MSKFKRSFVIINIVLWILPFIFFVLDESLADVKVARYADDIKEIMKPYKTEKILLLLDVDYVLYAPRDRVLRYAGEAGRYRADWFERLAKDFKDQTITLEGIEVPYASFLISTILFNGDIELVSPDMLDIINTISAQPNITALGFTANEPGRLGIVASQAELLVSRLRQLGYEFVGDHNHLFLEPMPECISSVVFTGKQPKSIAMVELLKHLSQPYQMVILIDDRMKNIQSVQAALENTSVNFLGIHYTELQDRNEPLSKSIAEKQFEVLYKDHMWLSDEQANDQLKRGLD